MRASFSFFTWSKRLGSLALLAAVSAFTGEVNAAVISNYAFTGNPASPAVTVAPAGATFSAFTRTNLTDDSQPNVFRTTGFSTSSTIDTTQHMGFTVTASGALALTFHALKFDHNRAGDGPTSGVIRYSLDGFATFAESFSWVIPTANTPNEIWDFTNFILNPGDVVEFRFYGFDAGDGRGSKFLTLDNVGFIERAASVPEPGSMLLAGMALFMGLGGRQLTKRRTRMAA